MIASPEIILALCSRDRYGETCTQIHDNPNTIGYNVAITLDEEPMQKRHGDSGNTWAA